MLSILTYIQDGLKKKNKYLQKDAFAVWKNKQGTAENEDIYIYICLSHCGEHICAGSYDPDLHSIDSSLGCRSAAALPTQGNTVAIWHTNQAEMVVFHKDI